MPRVDTAAVVEHVRSLAQAALCKVEDRWMCHRWPSAGTHLAPFGELADVGVRFITDCGAGVQNPLLMRRALEYASTVRNDRSLNQPTVLSSVAGTEMHEGEWSSRLGLPGAPAEAEEVMVMRDIALARLTGCTTALPDLVYRWIVCHRGCRPAVRRRE